MTVSRISACFALLALCAALPSLAIAKAKPKFKNGVYRDNKIDFQLTVKKSKIYLSNIPCLSGPKNSVQGTAGFGGKVVKISKTGKMKFSGPVRIGDDSRIIGTNQLVMTATFTRTKVTAKIVSFAGEVPCNAPITYTGKYLKGE